MRSREQRVRTQYEAWLTGRTPVALYVRWYLRHSGARYAASIFSAMGEGCFARVLDVGCATGAYLEWAFGHGHGRSRLAGVDLSPVMLSEATARLRPASDAGVEVVLREGSATQLPFADQAFDALICNGVVKYLDDEMLSLFLGEAARVLSPEGRIAVADFGALVAAQAAVMPPDRLGIPLDHLRSAAVLRQTLMDHGFTEVVELSLKRVPQIPLTYAGVVGTRGSG